ncbi:Hemolysin activation/secretion protein [Sporomusa malonica]|uniref:Hemolysin activation/secretion protein n=2 Tax=Sporomusa malonica TaxID=112901 RepID=A0A1W2EZ95_9FIRM|nr:Hemolysin activation/secretion protein [Sporomusa malonica]
MDLYKTHHIQHNKVCLLSTALLLTLVAPCFAAPAPDLPDAGQVLRSTQITGKFLPKEERPDLTVKEQPLRPPLSEAGGLKVRVEDITVINQDIFTTTELAALYQEQLHKELTFSELSQIAAKVTQYFKDHGYLVAQAYLPAQEFDQGRLEIAVVVGRYGDIILKNKSAISEQAIRQQLAALQPGAYINNKELERVALLVGDLAGVAAKLTLTPGKSAGIADCIVEVTDKIGDTHGSITVNNWGNRFIGRVQSALTYNVENLTDSGDTLSLSVTGADSDISLTGANYCLPVADGLTLNMGYSKVRYWLGEDYAYLEAHGTAYSKHADLTWALLRSRTSNMNLQFGYDHKTFSDRTDIISSVTDKSSHAVSLGLSGDNRDSYGGGGVTAYSLQWYDGGLSAQSNASVPPTGHWNKTAYNLFRQQTINKRLFLQTAFSGQWASTKLDSSERFSLGGANGVRAYPADEASGDEAWLFTGELHWNIPLKESKQTLQLVGFYDTGVSHIEKDSTDQDNRRSLSGAGLGILWGVPGDYAVKANYAWKAGSTAAQSDTDKNGRLWLQGVKYF